MLAKHWYSGLVSDVCPTASMSFLYNVFAYIYMILHSIGCRLLKPQTEEEHEGKGISAEKVQSTDSFDGRKQGSDRLLLRRISRDLKA